MGFCPESFRVCSLSSVETGERMVPFARIVRVMCQEMITSDNLANDLHWGGEHIKLNELHRCTQFSVLFSHLSFCLFSFTVAKFYAEFEMFSTQEDMQYSLS